MKYIFLLISFLFLSCNVGNDTFSDDIIGYWEVASNDGVGEYYKITKSNKEGYYFYETFIDGELFAKETVLFENGKFGPYTYNEKEKIFYIFSQPLRKIKTPN